jgi:hypothetical protein
VKYQRILLKIIEEEIDRFLTEQVAPPAAPPTPPADPSAAAPPADAPAGEEGNEAGSGEDKSEIKTALETLAAKTPIDIKKTLLSSLQNGAERSDTEALVAFVQNKLEDPEEKSEEEETETPVPNNVKKAVKHIIKTFKFKVPEKAEKKASEEEKKDDESEAAPPATPAAPPAAPAAPAAPVTESRLQTSLREYLMFKQLSKKVKRR